jgi:hypothetical protein
MRLLSDFCIIIEFAEIFDILVNSALTQLTWTTQSETPRQLSRRGWPSPSNISAKTTLHIRNEFQIWIRGPDGFFGWSNRGQRSLSHKCVSLNWFGCPPPLPTVVKLFKGCPPLPTVVKLFKGCSQEIQTGGQLMQDHLILLQCFQPMQETRI